MLLATTILGGRQNWLRVVVVFFIFFKSLWGVNYWEVAPENPAFLWDSRDIPEIENFQKGKKGEEKSKLKLAEPEVIVEQLQPKPQSDKKIVIPLPNLAQVLLVAAIILLFIIYRSRQTRGARTRKRL